jgi:hypothetical protein
MATTTDRKDRAMTTIYLIDTKTIKTTLESLGYISDEKTIDTMRQAMIAMNDGDPDRIIDGIAAHYHVAALNPCHD